MIDTMNMNSQNTRTQEAWDHSEGTVALALEKQTARIPSDVWLWGAVGSMCASFGLHFAGRRQDSLFVGQWAAPLMLIGVYNKIIKVAGSDRVHS